MKSEVELDQMIAQAFDNYEEAYRNAKTTSVDNCHLRQCHSYLRALCDVKGLSIKDRIAKINKIHLKVEEEINRCLTM